MHIRPLVFRTVILFVVINAAAGIAAILAGGDDQLGDTEGNILLSTLAISAAGSLMLICFIAFESRRPAPLPAFPAFAVAAVLIGFSLVLVLVWTDFQSDPFERATVTIVGIGLAATHVCLISLVRIRLAYVWLPLLAVALTVGLTASTVHLVWDEDRADLQWRIAAILAILTAAASFLVPVVDRMTHSRPGRNATPRRPSYCPNCGAVLHLDDPHCLACGVRFHVEFLR